MASCRLRTDLSACNEAIDRALTENPDLWWIYPKVWGLRERILKNLDSNEVISQLRRMESHQKRPSLLRTLAVGYWLAKRSDRAFESLTELCTRFPESRYSVQALNEAVYWISTQGLDHLSSPLEKLQVKVVNVVPTNPRLWKDRRSVLWLRSNSRVSPDGMRSLFEAWVEEDPVDPRPYLLLRTLCPGRGPRTKKPVDSSTGPLISITRREPLLPTSTCGIWPTGFVPGFGSGTGMPKGHWPTSRWLEQTDKADRRRPSKSRRQSGKALAISAGPKRSSWTPTEWDPRRPRSC